MHKTIRKPKALLIFLFQVKGKQSEKVITRESLKKLDVAKSLNVGNINIFPNSNFHTGIELVGHVWKSTYCEQPRVYITWCWSAAGRFRRCYEGSPLGAPTKPFHASGWPWPPGSFCMHLYATLRMAKMALATKIPLGTMHK